MKISKKQISALIILLLAAMFLASCGKVEYGQSRPPVSPDVKLQSDDSGNTGITEPESDYYTSPETEPETEPVTEPEPETQAEAVTIPDDGVIHVSSIELDHYSVTLEVGLCDMAWVTMAPADAVDKSEVWSSSNESIASVDNYGRIVGIAPGKCIVTVRSGDKATSGVKADIVVTVKEYPAISEPASFNGIVIINKSYPAPKDYFKGVDAEAYKAVNLMIAEAAEQGIDLFVISAFRTFEYQYNLYSNYLLRSGRDAADRYSARPGYSEHHTGLAFDLNSVEQSFGETTEGRWLAENCDKYGFIIRYPKEKEKQTGYMYEPWHVRYLGAETAAAVKASGLCLEEYLGIDSVYAE